MQVPVCVQMAMSTVLMTALSRTILYAGNYYWTLLVSFWYTLNILTWPDQLSQAFASFDLEKVILEYGGEPGAALVALLSLYAELKDAKGGVDTVKVLASMACKDAEAERRKRAVAILTGWKGRDPASKSVQKQP